MYLLINIRNERTNDLRLARVIPSPPTPLPMGFKMFTSIAHDNYLNTRPGSPPGFTPSPPVASPKARCGCAGVISIFDKWQLWHQCRDGGGNRIAEKRVRFSRAVVGISMSHSKALRLVGGFPGVQSVALVGDRDRIKVTGVVDVVNLTNKLRKKIGPVEIVSVG